ncbi:uncharacterized protein LOC130990482 [Salvia miltiorrhiza]|uniref:uncharacterized protein LOC130990482 n=1 Tax=Salvia miltiorrhiza TaxID=226208 RepID=UPI0025ABA31E|nr:uncharacterized protein LOC130990482 [Salvia miltiorrhiza]
MQEFRDALVYSGLSELEPPNTEFIWWNKRRGDMIYERLDRFVANRGWKDVFPCMVTKKWSKEKFGNLTKRIKKLREDRNKLVQNVNSKISEEQILELTKKIEHAVEEEACHWKQRALVNWLANGDRNTKAFHVQASKRNEKRILKV